MPRGKKSHKAHHPFKFLLFYHLSKWYSKVFLHFVSEFLTSLNNSVSLMKLFNLGISADFQIHVVLKMMHSLHLKDNTGLSVLLKTSENPGSFS